MHISEGHSVSALHREAFVAVAVFLVTALFFISLSVFATTVGTNVDATGTVGAATSTPWGDLAVDQVAGKGSLRPVFAVGDNGTSTPFIFVSQKGVVGFGTSTPSNIFLNPGDVVIGRSGATNDLFVSGGLGVGDATSTDHGFIAGGTNGITVWGGTTAALASGDVMIGATTSPSGFVVEKAHSIFSSGAAATTTVAIITESATIGGCIEMTAATDGGLYRVFINAAGNGLTVEAGSCAAN